MLRQVARKADQLPRQVQRQAQAAVLQVEVQFGGVFLRHALLAPRPHLRRQRAGDILGQAQRLADIADRAAAAVADHGGAQCRAVATVGVIDPLDHLLAPLVLEIHVDVGRFLAFGADETLEQQAAARGIDRGDAQHVAHRGIGGGPAALAQDVLRPRVAHDAVHREEIRCVLQLRDQPQFVAQLAVHRIRHAARIALCRALPGEAFQFLLRRQARRADLVGILVAQFVEREAAAFHDLPGARHRVRVLREQARHFLGRLQVAIDRAFPPEAGVVDGAAFADAGQHVLQDAALRRVVQHVAGGDGGHADAGRQVGRLAQPHRIVRAAVQGQRQVGAVGEIGAQAVQVLRRWARCTARRAGPRRMRGQIVPVQRAGALAGAALAQRQQAGQAGPGGPVGGIDQHRGAVGQVQPAARHQADAGLLRALVGAHHAGDRVAVGDAHRRQPVQRGLRHQFLDMRGAAQERVVRGDLKFGVAGHGGVYGSGRGDGREQAPAGTALPGHGRA